MDKNSIANIITDRIKAIEPGEFQAFETGNILKETYSRGWTKMLIPTKYENLNKNLLVSGAAIISYLNKKPYNIEELFQLMKKEKGMNLDQYFNCLTFLWLADILALENADLKLVSKRI
ncbi:MAG: hypothetical protein MUF15_19540 [Acidobacteria bacterium]|nr:hypothetical protein [Acidobacteriota bacterium]